MLDLIETDWPATSLDFSSDTRERYAGLHISQISRALCESRGVDKNPRGMSPEQVDGYAAVGFLEEGFSRMLVESIRSAGDGIAVVQPPAVAFNGLHGMLLEPKQKVPPGYIIGTPDWLEFENIPVPAIGGERTQIGLTDCKATYKSMGGAASPATWISKFRWDWEINTLFYALALQAVGIAVEFIRFRLLFMAGDYKPIRPLRKVWTSEPLKPAQLWDNFDMTRQAAAERGWL